MNDQRAMVTDEELTHIETRFARLVSYSVGPEVCWRWLGASSANRRGQRYGRFWQEGRMVYAHRFAFTAATGAEPTEQVLHRCDNPLCVNPAHLFQGTQTDNMRDAQAKKRLWERRGIDGRFVPRNTQ